MKKIDYIERIFSAYILRKNSQLTFWHENPEINTDADTQGIGQYYMTFAKKACYPGPFDSMGVPMLNYHGKVGKQYNPIAIAHFALANYNLAKKTNDKLYYDRFYKNAQWLLDNLAINSKGCYVWYHHFDFEYFRPLLAPWFSGLAQGQGLSVLVRTYVETKDNRYIHAADEVFRSLDIVIDDGGVLFKDDQKRLWIEEYIVTPPTHILNGFIWALWGIYDYYLLTRSNKALLLYESCVETLSENLYRFDAGFWSYYELTPQRIKSLASPYYHSLHIVQLRIMHKLTKKKIFSEYADKWEKYSQFFIFKALAILYKICFKFIYY